MNRRMPKTAAYAITVAPKCSAGGAVKKGPSAMDARHESSSGSVKAALFSLSMLWGGLGEGEALPC
eukprot:7095758-Prymnesium_polylepis.2